MNYEKFETWARRGRKTTVAAERSRERLGWGKMVIQATKNGDLMGFVWILYIYIYIYIFIIYLYNIFI